MNGEFDWTDFLAAWLMRTDMPRSVTAAEVLNFGLVAGTAAITPAKLGQMLAGQVDRFHGDDPAVVLRSEFDKHTKNRRYWVERYVIPARRDSYVYFAEATGVIKIGTSAEPPQRLRELQTGNHLPMTLIAVVPGGIAQERAIHKRFDHLRTRGEWFTAASDLFAFIDTLQWWERVRKDGCRR